MNLLHDSILVGAGATAVMDLWGIARTRLLGVPAPDYGLVGRWMAYLARGRFRHDAIRKSTPVRGEVAIGWTAHYAIGIAFAAVLLWIAGPEWIRHPTPGPALAVGIGTVLAPFLVMQPGMGAGIAARRTPRPWAARAQSLVTHAVFGFGLYSSALLLNLLKG
jgi:hypothetical protein